MLIYNPPGYLDFHHLKYANTNLNRSGAIGFWIVIYMCVRLCGIIYVYRIASKDFRNNIHEHLGQWMGIDVQQLPEVLQKSLQKWPDYHEGIPTHITHMYAHMYTYTHTYTHIHTCTWTYTPAHTWAHAWEHIHEHTHTHAYTHTHTHTYMYTHTHTHTNTHDYWWNPWWCRLATTTYSADPRCSTRGECVYVSVCLHASVQSCPCGFGSDTSTHTVHTVMCVSYI